MVSDINTDSSESAFSYPPVDQDFLESSKLYFSVAHDEYKREIDRSKGFEEKIGRLLTVLNLLIVAILAVFFSSSFETLLNSLSCGLKVLVLFLSFLLLGFIFISWWLLIQASHFTDVKRVSVDDNFRSWLSFKSSPEMYLFAGDQCRAAIEETSKSIQACKIKPLHRSLFFLKLSVVTLLGYFVLVLVLKFGAITVTNKTCDTSEKQQKPLREIPEYKPEPLRSVQESNVKPAKTSERLVERQEQK